MEQIVPEAPDFEELLDRDNHKIRSIEATFELTSPLFMAGGGNEENDAAELRPTGIKGALRFWWRALNWPRISNPDNVEALDEAQALVQLHQEECALFGAAHKKDTDRGAAVFSLQLLPVRKGFTLFNFAGKNNEGLQYLMGQGLQNQGTLLRKGYAAGGRFSIRIEANAQMSDAQWMSLNDALHAFSLLGGLGSRARKGLGSVALVAVQGDASFSVPDTRQAYIVSLKSLLATASNVRKLPPYTALSSFTRLDISLEARSPTLLENIGITQNEFRSFRKPKTRHVCVEQDHNMVLDAATTPSDKTAPPCQPARTVFGLPHNYYFSKQKPKLTVDFNVRLADASGTPSEARRASPLFIHIHKVGNDYLAVQFLMPAVFLPDSASLHLKSVQDRKERARHRFEFGASKINWALLHDYLNTFVKRKVIIEAIRGCV